MGLTQQRERIIRLYRVFKALVSKKIAAAERTSKIVKAIKEGFPGAQMLSEMMFGFQLQMVTRGLVAQDAEGQQEELYTLVEKMQKRINNPRLNVFFQTSHPMAMAASEMVMKRTSLIMKMVKGTPAQNLDDLFLWIKEWPRLSTKVYSIRNSTRILAAQARLVKAVITQAVSPAKEESDCDFD